MKATFLAENADEQWKADFIEMVSVPGYQFFAEMTQPRFIKTHLPFKLLPPSIAEARAKVVYVARHPKDVVVSYYHLNKLYRTQGYVNDFDTFFEYFTRDLCELKHFLALRVPKFSIDVVDSFLQYTGARILSTLRTAGVIVMTRMFYFFSTKIYWQIWKVRCGNSPTSWGSRSRTKTCQSCWII